MKSPYEAQVDLQKAANALLASIHADLDKAKSNMSIKDYRYELLRIAWVNRSGISARAHSTSNMAEAIWRHAALDRLWRERETTNEHP